MPAALVTRLDHVQQRFAGGFASPILERMRGGKIREGRGDLRPKHIADQEALLERLTKDRNTLAQTS